MRLRIEYQGRPTTSPPKHNCYTAYSALKALGFHPGKVYELDEYEQLLITLILAKHHAQVQGSNIRGTIPANHAILSVELSELCGVEVRLEVL